MLLCAPTFAQLRPAVLMREVILLQEAAHLSFLSSVAFLLAVDSGLSALCWSWSSALLALACLRVGLSFSRHCRIPSLHPYSSSLHKRLVITAKFARS
jgi:hypothetical protein